VNNNALLFSFFFAILLELTFIDVEEMNVITAFVLTYIKQFPFAEGRLHP